MKRPSQRQRHRSTSTGSYQDDVVFRNRSSSAGSYSEGLLTGQDSPTEEERLSTCAMLSSLPHFGNGRSWVHCRHTNLSLLKVLLDRSRQLDEYQEKQGLHLQGSKGACTTLQTQILLNVDGESGYTPLHSAIANGNLETILLLLRFSMDVDETERLTQRPMIVLHPNHKNTAIAPSSSATAYEELLYKMTTQVDNEGLTPLELLTRLQQRELQKCREALKQAREQPIQKFLRMASVGLSRRSSFDLQEGDSDQDEFQDLSRGLSSLQESAGLTLPNGADDESYACEVVAFGRAHQSTLGVTAGFKNSHTTSFPDTPETPTSPRKTTKQSTSMNSPSSNRASTTHRSLFRPQRVQAFAQDRVGRSGSAIAVAAATYHSLVATRDGQLFAFGLGKGGRLGNNEESQCPLPTRVLGALARKRVVSVAAAENHSLCSTSDGSVYGWGSNRFGQVLGCSGSTSDSNFSNSRCFLPRRVEDLKKVPCVAVAAGERHSVALSSRGEVWVWGDNTSGQLGIHRRNGIQKVQRVEALRGRIQAGLSLSLQQCIAIAASAQSTMALMSPASSSGLLPVNTVYTWGHGNHVPIKAHFGGDARASSQQQHQKQQPFSVRRKHDRTINPVAIACAKYHNVAITSDGHVYSWGLHAEPLGTKKNSEHHSPQKLQTQSPQLVTGMLPENGGGLAVAVAASEQHTAIVTDCGELYTWGATHGKNVLGHEGVKWQPCPKKVPGVHRAVGVAVAKEHTLLLIGTCFPKPPIDVLISGTKSRSEYDDQKDIKSLESLAAIKVAQHVDLFNAIPLLIMAERVQSRALTDYCKDFVRRNLDGVLNLGQKSLMDQYLNDRLADSLHRSGVRYRDDPHHHPFIHDVLTAGTVRRPTFENRDSWLSSTNEWIKACSQLACQRLVKSILRNLAESSDRTSNEAGEQRRKSRGQSISSEANEPSDQISTENQQPSICRADEDARILEHCKKVTGNLYLTNSEAAKAKYDWLMKEIRGSRKRLSQISRLEKASGHHLTPEESDKVARRPHLESMLVLLEPALEFVEKRLQDLKVSEKHNDDEKKGLVESSEADGEEKISDISLTCEICSIKCPDAKSFALHQNGRKHRNRVAQVAEEEKKQTAASIMENRLKNQLSVAQDHTIAPQNHSLRRNNAWNMERTTASEQPKFKLPPPPHPVMTQVSPGQKCIGERSTKKTSSVGAPTGPTDLRKIMVEQAGKSGLVPKSPKHGSSPSPWLSPSPTSTRVVPMSLSSTARPGISPSSKQSETKGKVLFPSPPTAGTTSPLSVWAAPSPGSTRCLPFNMHSPPKAANSKSNQTYSLGDFILPKQHLKKVSGPSPAPWSGTKLNGGVTTPSAASKSVSLLEIQQDEAEFISKQDQDFGVANGGSWFIGERRERADSFLAIQESDAKEREERLLIEEQLLIEAQIMKELEDQRKREAQAASKSNRNRKRNSNKHKGKNEANLARNEQTRKREDRTQPLDASIGASATSDVSNSQSSNRQSGGSNKHRNGRRHKKAAAATSSKLGGGNDCTKGSPTSYDP